MNYAIRDEFPPIRFYSLLMACIILELANILLQQSLAGLVITIPQVLIVLYLLYAKKNLHTALIWHIVFCLTSMDATSLLVDEQLISYAKVKLFGPFTLSYIILGLLWIEARRHPVNCGKDSMLLKLRRLLFILLISGTIIGGVGSLFYVHRWDDFIGPFRYMLVGVIYMDIFVRMCTKAHLKDYYNFAYILVIASPFVSFLTFYVMGIKANYGDDIDALVCNEVFTIAPMLIIMLLYTFRFKCIMLVSLVLYFACLFSAGRGGYFLGVFVSLVCVVYITYFSHPGIRPQIVRIMKWIMPVAIILGVAFFSTLVFSLDSSSLGGMKFHQLMNLMQFFLGPSSGASELASMSSSPYIRIAEVLNIFDNGLANPLALIFGHGYGGYYTDSAGLFVFVDVSQGGFPTEVVASGKFGTAHSMLPNTLLFHGLIGVFLVVKMGFAYLRKVGVTPFCFAAFMLFFMALYFNPSILIVALFALVAAEYKLSANSKP